MRTNERKNNELRPVEFIPNYIMHPEGAVLISITPFYARTGKRLDYS